MKNKIFWIVYCIVLGLLLIYVIWLFYDKYQDKKKADEQDAVFKQTINTLNDRIDKYNELIQERIEEQEKKGGKLIDLTPTGQSQITPKKTAAKKSTASKKAPIAQA